MTADVRDRLKIIAPHEVFVSYTNTFVRRSFFTMKQIPLSRGRFTTVDDSDYEWLNQWHWWAQVKKNGYAYAVRTEGTQPHRKMIRMHRFILGIEDAEILVDHKDCDGLNNTRANLRRATTQQNNCNHRLRKDNKTGYKGVWWNADSNMYQAYIRTNGKAHIIGYSTCPKTCARTYNQKALELFGEYSRLNKVEDGPLCPEMTLRSSNTSGYRGVTWHKKDKKWVVQIMKNGERLLYASVDDKILAAKMYDTKSFEINGHKAKLNFPEHYAHIKIEQP